METNHKGKGFTKYFYTLENISEVSSTPVNTIRQHMLRQKVDPNSLASVVEYVLNRRERNGDNGDTGLSSQGDTDPTRG